MPQLIDLPTFSDSRGDLTVIEKVLPFDIKRVYYIYNVKETRGGHRHKKTIQALVCLNGSCDIVVTKGSDKSITTLTSPKQTFIVFPEDYHTMENFSEHAILMVISSEFFDADDYIDTPL